MLDIIRRNVLTPFVLIIAVIVAILLVLQRSGDALFLGSTISINCLVGIIQETRAQRALHALELLVQTMVRRHTKAGYELIPASDIQIGDHIEVNRGDQVPADGIILSAHAAQVNESLLTGESRELGRGKGDQLLAGSAMVSGSAIFSVTACGTGTRAGQMNASLKTYEQRLSPLQRDLAEILRWLTYLSVLATLAIIISGQHNGRPLQDIVTMVVAGAITLVPEGLVLAATLLFAYGAVQIARKGVLVHHLPALEGFGRLKTLCLDKTGTLTEATLDMEELHSVFPYPEHRFKEMLAGFLAAEEEPSPTLQALIPHLPENRLTILSAMAFSSSRKYSAILAQMPSREQRCLMLGAPEVVERKARLTQALQDRIAELSQQGLRVLLLADFGQPTGSLGETLEGSGNPVGIVVLRHRLRPGIADAVFYLQARGISLKVISGDAPGTVQAIAHEVGILNTDKVITGSELAELDEMDWEKTVPETVVFARTLPEQKERIIATLRKHGYTGMVGDGVNDALALKQSDLGIAMLQGSSAAREVADIILTGNEFAVFPQAVRLASRIILGLQMVACLFFNKVAYGMTLLSWSLAFGTDYPFAARHLIVINFLAIGLPTFLWSLVPPEAAYRLDPRRFFSKVVAFSVPNGIITALAVIALSVVSRLQESKGWESGALIITLVLGIFSFSLIPHFLHAVDSLAQRRMRTMYFVFCAVVLFGASFLPNTRDILQLAGMDRMAIVDTLILTAIAAAAQWHLSKKRPLFQLPLHESLG